MSKSFVGLVEKHLGDFLKINLGINTSNIDVEVLYMDEYDQKYEYRFKFDKETKESKFGSNVSRNVLYKLNSGREVEFESEVIDSFLQSC